jgi:hypothetical protein
MPITPVLVAVLIAGIGLVLSPGVSWASPPSPAPAQANSTTELEEAQTSIALLSSTPPGWTALHPAGHPPKVTGEVLVFDPMDRYVLLFGGQTHFGSGLPVSDQTWIFANHSWAQLTLARSPPGRTGAAASYDPVLHQIVMFGGEDLGVNTRSPHYFNDTWTFGGGRWTRWVPTGPSPLGRFEASMAYDPELRGVLLFGGGDLKTSHGGPELHDTWTFNGTAWTHSPPTPAPSGRRLAGMTYDTARHAILLFGGCSTGICGNGLSDTWEFRAGHWTNLTSPIAPADRIGPMLVYEPKLGESVLFGGANASSELNDTWVLGSTTWALVCSSCGPTPRYDAGATYDPLVGGILLVGGLVPGPRTWAFS